ncbi:MAG: DNA adenine methylase, partial [Candidatus Paceibacterota bacterium]
MKNFPNSNDSSALLELDLQSTDCESTAIGRSRPYPIARSEVSTQGIKYAGSKLKLLPNILKIIEGLEIQTVLDGFSGSTRVSQALAKRGYQVTS